MLQLYRSGPGVAKPGGRAWTWRDSSRVGGLHGLRWARGIGCARHDQDTVVAGVRSPLAFKSIEQASRPRTTERDQVAQP